MKCPKCSGETRVTETRFVNSYNRRRRVCVDVACNYRFATVETEAVPGRQSVGAVHFVLPLAVARELRNALAIIDRRLPAAPSDPNEPEPELLEDLERDASDGGGDDA